MSRNLPPLNATDGNADDLMGFFDFAQIPKGPLVLQERTCPPLTPAARKLMETTADEDAD